MLRPRNRSSDWRRAALLLLALGTLALPAAAAADVTSTVVSGPATQPVHGEIATLTATVANTTTPANVPTGTVQFTIDGAPTGAAIALSPTGTAQLTTAPLTVGGHAVRAELPRRGRLRLERGHDDTDSPACKNVDSREDHAEHRRCGRSGSRLGGGGQPHDARIGRPHRHDHGVRVRPTATAGHAAALDAFLRGGLMMGAASLTLDIAYSGDMSYEGSASSAVVTVGKAGTLIALSRDAEPGQGRRRGHVHCAGRLVRAQQMVAIGPAHGHHRRTDRFQARSRSTAAGESSDSRASSRRPAVHRVTAHFTGDARLQRQ